jgi:hypothetical protein
LSNGHADPQASDNAKREPFAFANLTWTLGIVVALGVIAKVFSVAGYNISSALLILKSANILTTAIGILVSNLQFTSFAVLLFLISLYMQAEWPVRDRNEREVNVLAVSVFVCVVMVVAVAAWPLGVITLAATLSYLATRERAAT